MRTGKRGSGINKGHSERFQLRRTFKYSWQTEIGVYYLYWAWNSSWTNEPAERRGEGPSNAPSSSSIGGYSDKHEMFRQYLTILTPVIQDKPSESQLLNMHDRLAYHVTNTYHTNNKKLSNVAFAGR